MKLFLAPIQGMTIAYYRNLYSELFGGIDAYYAPFIATTGVRKSSTSLFKDIDKEFNNKNIEVVPQLLGNNADDFKYFAKKIVDRGYKEINWNIGCPFPTVTKKKKGSGILPHPDMIKNFLDEVCLDESFDLTVKLRLGLNNLEEGMKVIELLNDYPLKGVMIHGRTGAQKYEGTVDLDAFETMYSKSKHEMTYNGDIFTVEDFKKIQARFPNINNFMIGRGALIDPFLPAAIKGVILSDDQKILKIKEFHDSAYNHYKSILSGDKHLCDKMKEFWAYTSVNIDQDGKFMKKIRKCKTDAVYSDLVKEKFKSQLKWK